MTSSQSFWCLSVLLWQVCPTEGQYQNDPYFEYTTYAKALDTAVEELEDEKESSLEESMIREKILQY